MTLTSTDIILFIEIIGNPDKSKNRLNVSYCGETTTLPNNIILSIILSVSNLFPHIEVLLGVLFSPLYSLFVMSVGVDAVLFHSSLSFSTIHINYVVRIIRFAGPRVAKTKKKLSLK